MDKKTDSNKQRWTTNQKRVKRHETGQKNIPKFIKKTYEALSNFQYKDIICWSTDGLRIVIKSIEKFEAIVLPQLFRHNKFKTFVRQLHLYNFQKIKDKSFQKNTQNYRNLFFRRDNSNQLEHIKSKQNHVQNDTPNHHFEELLGLTEEWPKNNCSNDLTINFEKNIPENSEDLYQKDHLVYLNEISDIASCFKLYVNCQKPGFISQENASLIIKITNTYMKSIEKIINSEQRGLTVIDNMTNTTSLSESNCFTNITTDFHKTDCLTNFSIDSLVAENDIIIDEYKQDPLNDNCIDDVLLAKTSQDSLNDYRIDDVLLAKKSFKVLFDESDQNIYSELADKFSTPNYTPKMIKESQYDFDFIDDQNDQFKSVFDQSVNEYSNYYDLYRKFSN